MDKTMTPEALRRAGWRERREEGYAATIGPIWERQGTGGPCYGLLAEARHVNRNGTVHGGVLLGLADHALGYASSRATDGARQATIHLDLDFLAPAFPGDFISVETAISRRTRSIVFVRGTLLVGATAVATASGLWKVLGA